jgi:hypothetical protein
MSLETVVNLDAYPIHQPGSAAVSDLAARLSEDLERQQYVVLPDFIRPEARTRAVAQVEAALPRANHNCSDRNCYLQRSGDPALPADHPRNRLMPASTWMLAADLLPDDSPLKTIYYAPEMKDFVAGIVGAQALYFNEDPLQPVNALCYRTGDRSAWHFDSVNAFTMTLMLQAPESGGRFEMVPNTRTDDDPCVERVARALNGEEPAVEVGREEGALCIFRGCNSLHRVSPVDGERLRIMGVFVYENRPGVTGDPEVNRTVYGRATAAA